MTPFGTYAKAILRREEGTQGDNREKTKQTVKEARKIKPFDSGSRAESRETTGGAGRPGKEMIP